MDKTEKNVVVEESGDNVQTLFDSMTTSEWTFNQENVDESIKSFTDGINKLWNLSRTGKTLEAMDSAEREAKKASRQWRRFILTAEQRVPYTISLNKFEEIAYEFGKIQNEKRNPDHAILWKCISKFMLGWKDYSGNFRDQESFGRLSDYLAFRESLTLYGMHYEDLIKKVLSR